MSVRFLRMGLAIVVAFVAMVVCARPAAAQATFGVTANIMADMYTTVGYPKPDANGAVGPNHVVEMINGHFEIFDKATLSIQPAFPGLTAGAVTLNDFFTRSGVTPTNSTYDPRVLYDSFAQRWYACAADNADQPNHFLFAVSKTSNPTQGWNAFSFDTSTTGTRFADFPRLSFNKDGVYMMAYAKPINGGAADGKQTVVVLPKADLLAATPTAANAKFIYELPVYSATAPSLGPWGQPAVNYDNTSGPINVLSDFLTHKGYLSWNKISGGPANPTVAGPATYVTTPIYNPPVNALQPGTLSNTVDADSARFSTAVQVNGSVWAVQDVSIAGRNALRWVEMNATTGAIKQQGTINNSTLSYYYPSIAVNANKDVVIGFNGSSGVNPISAYAVLGKTSGTTTTFSAPQLLQQGYGTVDLVPNAPEEWGDYSATVVDPSNSNVFWTFQQVAKQGNNWGISISKLTTQPVAQKSFGVSVASVDNDTILHLKAGVTVQGVSNISNGIKKPASVIFDATGREYVADTTKATIYTFDSNNNQQVLANFADGLVSPLGMAFGSNGRLYVADISASKIVSLASNTTNTVFADAADGLKKPWDVAFDTLGNLYVTDIAAQKVFKIDSSGNTTVFADKADGLYAPTGLAVDGLGNVYVSDQFTNQIFRFTPLGVGTVLADVGDGLNAPLELEISSDGFLYVANYLSDTIMKFNGLGVGTIYADAADGINGPYDLAFKPGATALSQFATLRVPEPASWLLALAGMACLYRWRRQERGNSPVRR